MLGEFIGHQVYCKFAVIQAKFRYTPRHYNINHINNSTKLVFLDKNGYKTTTKGDKRNEVKPNIYHAIDKIELI